LIFKYCSDLSDDWLVWHSSDWYDDECDEIGESDFIFLHKNFGLISLEVKGGRVEYSNKKWNTLNNKNPFHQARVSMHFWVNRYIKYIKENYSDDCDEFLYCEKFPGVYWFCCAFPFVYFKKQLKKNNISLNEAKEEMIFDKSDCDEQEAWKKLNKEESSPFEKFLLNIFVFKNKNNIRLKEGVAEKFSQMMNSLSDHKFEYLINQLIEKKHLSL